MKKWKICCGGVVLAAGLASQAGAQAPPPPAVAAVPAVPVAAAPVAAPANIWTFLCLSPEQKAACKTKFCNSALGQMLNNGLKPVSAFSGGLVGPCCPPFTAIDLAKPADSAEGAAARIKADEAAAKARREAVRYLGTVDCNYWPEAQDALINALRADRNECVRLEAAAALGHGCCCNRATIKALMLTASGSTEDGNPAERSDRVRAWAHAALAHCLAVFCEETPVPAEPVKGPVREGPPPELPTPPEGEPRRPEPLQTPPAPIPPGTTGRANPVEYYRRAEGVKREQLIEEAKRVLEKKTPLAGAQAAPPLAGRSLADVFNYAMNGHGAPAVGAPAVAEKPTTPAATVEKAEPPPAPAEKPVIPTVPVWQKSPPPSAKPSPVTRTAPTPYSPAPTPVAPVVHRDTPATPAPAPAELPALRTPDLPPAPSPQGAPVPVAYMSVLQGSKAADQREWAAENLGGFDGWTNPRVVEALARAAREDSSPLVRATCLRSLARMNVQSVPVLVAVREARQDGDPRVRSEAEQALRQLGADDPGLGAPATPAAMPK